MNPDPANDPDEQAAYTLDIVAQITGVSSETIIHYQEQGLIQPATPTGGFDDETVHTLRRIEHLRHTSDANLTGIRIMLELLDEVDRLKAALRARR